MTRQQGVSKATGLRAAVETLPASTHNTLAIGDAENDHELLRLAEVGAAVEWGSASLPAAADVMIKGSGPPAVARYMRRIADTARLPAPPSPRVHVLLCYADDGLHMSV